MQRLYGLESWTRAHIPLSSLVQEIVRTSDIRVSERVPLNSLRLQPFGPIYNELTGEVIL